MNLQFYLGVYMYCLPSPLFSHAFYSASDVFHTFVSLVLWHLAQQCYLRKQNSTITSIDCHIFLQNWFL